MDERVRRGVSRAPQRVCLESNHLFLDEAIREGSARSRGARRLLMKAWGCGKGSRVDIPLIAS